MTSTSSAAGPAAAAASGFDIIGEGDGTFQEHERVFAFHKGMLYNAKVRTTRCRSDVGVLVVTACIGRALLPWRDCEFDALLCLLLRLRFAIAAVDPQSRDGGKSRQHTAG
jgi:hypothetical protein